MAEKEITEKSVCVCVYVTGCPYPMTIELVPAFTGGMEPWSDYGERVKDPIFPTQWTDVVSTHTHTHYWVTALCRITREFKSGKLRGIPNLILYREENPPGPKFCSCSKLKQ